RLAACPILFFVSSRRRHTRSKRDWSSDVCSSDLLSSIHLKMGLFFVIDNTLNGQEITPFLNELRTDSDTFYFENFYHQTAQGKRSEERRVGKECRKRRTRWHEQQQTQQQSVQARK